MHNTNHRFIVVFVLLVAACYSETAHLLAQRQRLLARQEQAPSSPNPTGYPAAGETPEVPFEIPDNTYGPPSSTIPDNIYGAPPSSASDDEAPQPEIKDQPLPTDAPAESESNDDEQEQEVVVEYAEDGSVIAISTSFDQDAVNESGNNERLVYQRFPQPHRSRQPPTSESLAVRSARLQQAKNLRILQPVQGFIYAAQLK